MLSRADVAIAAGRIACVGDLPGPVRETLDVDGGVIVPGLIDPHCHMDLLCTPSAFAAAAVTHGTTAVVADLYGLTRFLPDVELAAVLEALDHAPMKLLWGLRPSLAAGGAEDLPGHAGERLSELLDWPGIAGAGELTAWPALLAGDERLGRFVTELIDAGLRVDGHAPGASRRTLGRLLAAGVMSDHEAITGEELASRIELGLWTMVRALQPATGRRRAGQGDRRAEPPDRPPDADSRRPDARRCRLLARRRGRETDASGRGSIPSPP